MSIVRRLPGKEEYRRFPVPSVVFEALLDECGPDRQPRLPKARQAAKQIARLMLPSVKN